MSPAILGGMAGYARVLAAALKETGRDGFFMTLQGESDGAIGGREPLPWPVRYMGNRRTFDRFWHPLFSRFASRPKLHGVVPLLTSAAFVEPRMSTFDKTSVIHYVGTGWSFIGFQLLRIARRLGVPFSILPAVHPNNWGDDPIDLRLYKLADVVFCLSVGEAQHLIDRGLRKERIVQGVLPPMCRRDGVGERLRNKLQIDLRPTVLFLGRRDSGKGYPALLLAWKEVIRVLPEAVLLLAGPGGQEFEHFKAHLPMRSFRDLGVPDEQEKADALSACDLFCLPSSHESFGIVYVEAWSYGKPVICGTAPACRELVKDGEAGIWGNQDPQSLAQKLIDLLGNANEAKRMGTIGRTLQQMHYTGEAMRDAHLEAWNSMRRRNWIQQCGCT